MSPCHPTEVPEEPEPPTLDYNEQLEREDYEDCTVLGLTGALWGPIPHGPTVCVPLCPQLSTSGGSRSPANPQTGGNPSGSGPNRRQRRVSAGTQGQG